MSDWVAAQHRVNDPMAIGPRPCNVSRRRWLAGLACGIAAAARSGASEEPWAEVWVDLDEPVAAGTRDAAAAQARRERVAAQQERVALELRALGAIELARVHHARNAIAVRPPQLMSGRA
jgi:hypothetical protein